MERFKSLEEVQKNQQHIDIASCARIYKFFFYKGPKSLPLQKISCKRKNK